MEQIIKLLSHIRGAIMQLVTVIGGLPIPANLHHLRRWDVNNTPLPVAVSETTVKVYGLHVFNPSFETVYLRMYDVINPDFKTDLPFEIIELPPESGFTKPLDGNVKYEADLNLCLVATSSFNPHLSAPVFNIFGYPSDGDPSDGDGYPSDGDGYPSVMGSASIYVSIHYAATLPQLAPGQSFITDSQGNYLIDSEGNYLITISS